MKLATLLLWTILLSTNLHAKEYLRFSGGPSGGTFQIFSNGISSLINQELKSEFKITPQGSGGSTENLRKLNSKRAHLGVVHSGDLFLGRLGTLKNDKKEYTQVLALATLYRSAAQLVAKGSSDLKSLGDLAGHRVGIGGAGSGAAASAERFFNKVGLWSKIKPQFLGYSKAAAAIKDGQLDAMWVVSGYPTRAIMELSATTKVSFISLENTAKAKNLFTEYPFYQPVSLPGKTYDGQTKPYMTFADSTLLVANAKVKDETVYKLLKTIFSDKGRKNLATVNKAAENLNAKDSLAGIKVPLHPGAKKFYKEAGLVVPENI